MLSPDTRPLALVKRRKLRLSAAAVAFLACTCAVGAGEYHVDPESGVDAEGRGSIEQPFRTVRFALEQVALLEEVEAAVRVTAGRVRAGEVVDGGVDLLPWTIPEGLRRLEILGPESPGSICVIEVIDSELEILTGDPPPPSAEDGAPAEIVLRNLYVEGGHSALSVAGAEGRDLDVTVDSCFFQAQSGAAIEVISGAGATTRVEVVASDFWFCGGALSVEGLEDSELDLTISENQITDILPLGLAGRLGGAVEIHLEPGARVSPRIERNTFQHTGTAICLTSSETVGGEARLEGTVSSNLFFSSNSPFCDWDYPADCGLYLAFYLALAPDLPVQLRVDNNTFWAVQRQVIFAERDEVLDDVSRSISLRDNIFWGPSDRRYPTGSLGGDPDHVPAGVQVEGNIVPASWTEGPLGANNFSADPSFVDQYEDDFHLLPDSPAIDAGDPALAEGLGDLDRDGLCRRARGSESAPPDTYLVDLGALELAGPCDPGLLLSFRRGDCNLNTRIEMSDAVGLFMFLFLGGTELRCEDACDANDDGRRDITDGIFTLNYLFLGGSAPPAPFASPGHDPTPDALEECLATSP